MTLKEWQKNKWLKKEPSSAKEIADLFALAERNLNDASIELISLDAQLQFAFNAALACATIALRASGYRIPTTEGHHEKTVNSLRFTLGSDSNLINKLNGFRKKRSKVAYDAVGITSRSEVDSLLEMAFNLRGQVEDWLSQNHPDLYK